MTASTVNIEQQSCFLFKANFLPCTIFQLLQYDLSLIEQQLITTIRRAPQFFLGLPVVLDLDKLQSLSATIDFSKLKHILTTHGLIPIGIHGGNQDQQKIAIHHGLSILSVGKLAQSEANKKKTDSKSSTPTKIITTTVRSGMQIYARDGDLVVVAAVSPGAELFADGNIHVYGPLRGRALAGVQGNIQARIFCRALEAELVSIAGYYLTKDDIPPLSKADGMVKVYLEDLKVRVQAVGY